MNANTKGILISASNCSGKSYMLRAASSADFDNTLCVFEMDSLRYYHTIVLNKRLPKAKEFLSDWLSNQDENGLIQEFRHNIESSPPDAQLIKIKFVELALCENNFVTVLPQILRHSNSGGRFIELLEEIFPIRIVRVALIPSNARLLLNFLRRLRIWNVFYVTRARTERNSLISNSSDFDHIVENNLQGKGEDIFVEKLRDILNNDRRG